MLSPITNTKVSIAILFLFLFYISLSTLGADLYGQDLYWNSGIESRIPDREDEVNVLDFGALGDGYTNDYAAFQSAIDSVSKGGVVFIPEGEYVLNDMLKFDKALTLRGAGENKTQLIIDHNNNGFEIVSDQKGDWYDIISNYEKGSRDLYLKDASAFEVGMYVEIQQDNNPDIMYPNPSGLNWDSEWAQGAIAQIARIVAVDGNKISIDEPLRLNYDSKFNPVIRKQDFIEYLGFENFGLIRRDLSDSYVFYFENVANSWIRNIRSVYGNRAHVHINTGYRIEIRDSRFEMTWGNTNERGVGIELGYHATNCLIENNIFKDLTNSIVLRLGANSNVIAYNYMIDDYSHPSVWFLGHYPNNNLIEGNIMSDIVISEKWGASGPGNTFFRNRIKNLFTIEEASNPQIIIANEIGDKINWDTYYTYPDLIDYDVFLIHANFIGRSIQWDEEIEDYDIPQSLYLDSKPEFFGLMDWPFTGSDKINGSNPARERYYNRDVFNIPKEILLGDLNGDGIIDSLDYILLARHLLGIRDLNPNYLKAADLNADALLDSLDLSILGRCILGHVYTNDIIVELVDSESALPINNAILTIVNYDDLIETAEALGEDGLYKFKDIKLGLGTEFEINISKESYIDTSISMLSQKIAGSEPLSIVDNDSIEMYQEKVIEFEDINLEFLIRSEINKGFGPIYLSDVKGIEILNGWRKGIRSLEGIQFLYNLKNLRLAENYINDLYPISALRKLEELDISANELDDLSPLAELNTLSLLSINDNQLADISPLAGLSNLKLLDFSKNQVLEISSLSKLTALEHLIFHKNKVLDISPLKNLSKLYWLGFSANNVDDISVLLENDFPNLSMLSIMDNLLNFEDSSEDMNKVETLMDKGISIIY
ncbi:glycosyl hydrolase family 28-related protein [Natronospora cellulosivora (SeqCode)]